MSRTVLFFMSSLGAKAALPPALLVIVLASLISHSALAKTSQPVDPQLKQSNVGAYLGLGLDLLPKELQAQLPEDVLVGQGVMVSGFSNKSPAPKQGIKLYDVILNYNQYPLMHPKQLIRLIKRDKPGGKATLTIARKGKIIKLPIVLGSENYPLNEDQLDYQYNLQVFGYDGMKIKQLSKNYFEATIRYLDPQGVVRRRTFSGPYPVIMQQIYAAPDLSKIAKKSLTHAITKRKEDEEGWFGDMLPFSDGNFNFF